MNLIFLLIFAVMILAIYRLDYKTWKDDRETREKINRLTIAIARKLNVPENTSDSIMLDCPIEPRDDDRADELEAERLGATAFEPCGDEKVKEIDF